MKNIKSLLLIVGVALMVFGCVVEDQKVVTPSEAAANLYAPSDVPFLFGVTQEVAFDVELAENPGATVSSVIVKKQLFTTNGDSPVAEFTSAGATISQSKSDMFADVPVAGGVLTEDDLTPGDRWVFSYQLQLSNGKTVTIPASGSTTITFQCLSELAGTYNAVGTGGSIFGDYPPGLSNVTWDGKGVVTLTELTPGVYEMDNTTGEFYVQYWGGDAEVGTFRDVCDVFTIDTKNDQWGYPLTATVTNHGDASFTVDWANTYGDHGSTLMTPQ